MSVYHDEIEIEDFEYNEEDELYFYPCPCGDRFEITKVRVLMNTGRPGFFYLPNTTCFRIKIF